MNYGLSGPLSEDSLFYHHVVSNYRIVKNGDKCDTARMRSFGVLAAFRFRAHEHGDERASRFVLDTIGRIEAYQISRFDSRYLKFHAMETYLEIFKIPSDMDLLRLSAVDTINIVMSNP